MPRKSKRSWTDRSPAPGSDGAGARSRRPNSSRKPGLRRPACSKQESKKAIAAAEQIMTKAREAAAQDHDRMLAELKREVGRLVVQATTTVTGKILTAEDQRRLAEETAKQIAA